MKTPAKVFAAALLLASAVSALAGVHYVDVNSTNATPPYTSWATAATNIQDAVDAAVPGDEIVVTNGIYATGGRAINGSTTNRVAVDKALSLRSINGPEFTTIDGAYGGRCVYLTNGASLLGFRLIHGLALSGAGISCESTNAVVSNCVLSDNLTSFPEGRNLLGIGGGANGGTLNTCTLIGNSAIASGDNAFGGGAAYCTLNNCTLSSNSARGGNSGGSGGGAAFCTLNNCTLITNSASYGGGAWSSTLNNCTLSGNSAGSGGGAYGGTLNNCIVYFNTASLGANYDFTCTLNYSCTTPQPTNGFDNITNAPLFVDQASGNLRLQSNSPCINAGLNVFAPAGLDLDGLPRIKGGTVDIGAYEIQLPASMISYAWLQQYGLLPANGSTDNADPDGDGVNNYGEWLAGSDPTNPFSFPPLLTLIPYGANVILTWPTNAVGFTLQSTTNLASPAVWTTNSPAPVVIGGQNVVINPITGPQQFYRLKQ